MALHLGIGQPRKVSPGRTHLWEVTYPNGQNVGVIVAAPNQVQDFPLNIELIALEPGVITRQPGGRFRA